MQMPDGDYAIVERDDVALHLFQDAVTNRPPVSFHIFASGLDELALSRAIEAGQFPRPYQTRGARRKVWKSSEIQRWMATSQASRR